MSFLGGEAAMRTGKTKQLCKTLQCSIQLPRLTKGSRLFCCRAILVRNLSLVLELAGRLATMQSGANPFLGEGGEGSDLSELFCDIISQVK